ncbi:MAG: RNB domain-containing ribonuclease [Actinobacteria bacterium]|nr:RNB domain-containing ribonuclease [Actinomycetota bacterium]
MTRTHLRAAPDAPEPLVRAFAEIRDEFSIPEAFPAEVLDEADDIVRRGATYRDHVDLRSLAFVTIDPVGSMDLDQAMHIERDGDGFVIRYAIVDLDAWIPLGGAVDTEARRRGVTVYTPDRRTPLYPPALSEAAASLLPDGDRPAVVFHIAVAADGEVGSVRMIRAVIRSTARLDYRSGLVANLQAAGEALAAAAARRGAVQIDMPGQEVVRTDDTLGFALRLEERVPQEDWNAQVSLAANVAAARLMAAARVGLFRVMGDVDPVRAAGLRAAARALGLTTSDDRDDLRAIVSARGPADAVDRIRQTARRLPRGAGYLAEDGRATIRPWHAAVAAPYAHATAPMRRLADRHVLDLAVRLSSGGAPPRGTAGLMAELQDVMNTAERRAEQVEAAVVNLVEAMMLSHRVGDVFPAVVTGAQNDGAQIQLRTPAVRANLKDVPKLEPGETVEVRLEEADPARRLVRFALVA